jgi:glycosyltransferase involved in cell wall biosynthesis
MHQEQNKILFVSHSLRGGGAEKVAATLLEHLQKSDDLQIKLVLFQKEEVVISRENLEIEFLDIPAKKNFLYTCFKFVRILVVLTGIIRREKPRSILGFMEYSNILSILANRLGGTGCRVVASVHNAPSNRTSEYKKDYWEKVIDLLMRVLYNSASAIVVVSRSIGRELVDKYGIREELVHVISNPIDLEKVRSLARAEADSPFPGGELILSAGRLTKQKGFDDLLPAFSMLGDTGAHVVVLGAGREEQNLKRLASGLGIENRVTFAGYRENPYAYMRRATLFVLASRYEGFGVVLVEAMACGLPVVSTRSYDGIDNIIEDGKTGLLVDVGDRRGLADAIRSLLENPARRASMAEAGRRKAEEFSVEKIAGQYRKVLLQ